MRWLSERILGPKPAPLGLCFLIQCLSLSGGVLGGAHREWAKHRSQHLPDRQGYAQQQQARSPARQV